MPSEKLCPEEKESMPRDTIYGGCVVNFVIVLACIHTVEYATFRPQVLIAMETFWSAAGYLRSGCI